MAYDLPPIIKSAEQLLAAAYAAASGFPRKHRYSLGTRLEEDARAVVRMATRAARESQRKLHWAEQLVWAVDEVKFTLRLAKDAEALKGFAQFEALIHLAENVGRQAGGWRRQLQQHSKGQNSESHGGAPERAKTLSTRPASMGAHA